MRHFRPSMIVALLAGLLCAAPAGADLTGPVQEPPSPAPSGRPSAEARNGLGYALRNQGKYPDSIKAYDQALRLRHGFPEALEYLGEAYVRVRRLDDARRVLERLKPLDAARAKELAEVIEKGK